MSLVETLIPAAVVVIFWTLIQMAAARDQRKTEKHIKRENMKLPTGTKSLLFGVHQFIWHPITVWLAWRSLYGIPGWRIAVCIVVHDWGYWGCEKMDDEKGELHPILGARIAGKLFGNPWDSFCLYHSRHLARRDGISPSKLCWADKLSLLYEPAWWYLFRGWLSGEIYEYRENAIRSGAVPAGASFLQWFRETKRRCVLLGKEQRGDAVPYVNPTRP